MMRLHGNVFGLPESLEYVSSFHRGVLILSNIVLFIVLYLFRAFSMIPWVLRLGGTGTFEENAAYVLVMAFVQAVFDAAMINLLVCYVASLKVDSPVLRLVMRRSISVAVWTMPFLQVVPYFRPE